MPASTSQKYIPQKRSKESASKVSKVVPYRSKSAEACLTIGSVTKPRSLQKRPQPVISYTCESAVSPEEKKKSEVKKKEKGNTIITDPERLKQYEALRKKNNDREDQLLRRLAIINDDDCKLGDLKQGVTALHQTIKRADQGLHDQTDRFRGCLAKSCEYLNVIQQHRRIQAHKMALLLDRADEECKKTNQLLEDHFQDIDCVYQLMKPDATPLQLIKAVCRQWARSFQSFWRFLMGH